MRKKKNFVKKKHKKVAKKLDLLLWQKQRKHGYVEKSEVNFDKQVGYSTVYIYMWVVYIITAKATLLWCIF